MRSIGVSISVRLKMDWQVLAFGCWQCEIVDMHLYEGIWTVMSVGTSLANNALQLTAADARVSNRDMKSDPQVCTWKSGSASVAELDR